MGAMADVCRMCEGRWVRYDDAARGLMGPERRRLKSSFHSLYRTGRLERRESEQGGLEYRAVPGWHVRDQDVGPVSAGILAVLGPEPLSTREVASAAGRPVHSVRDALERLARRGVVERAGTAGGGMALWRAGREPYTSIETPYDKEGPGMGDKDKTKSKPPYPSKEAEECENDTRNEP